MTEEKREERKSREWVRILLLIIASSLVIGGCSQLRQEEPENYTGPIEKITLAGYAGEAGALVYIANEQGLFKENGLDVTIKDYQSGKAAADSLIAGEADISTSADLVFVSNAAEHTDLRVLGTVATYETKELVARKDKGITAINDLVGKKIGVTKKSGAEFLLGVFLTYNGISQEDVELVDLRPPEMMEAISNGVVDAVFVWDPYAFRIKKQLGDNAISWHGGGDFYFVLLTKEDWLDKNPAAAERFMKSMLEAEKYVQDNKNETKKFVKDRFDYESDYIDYSWPKQEYTVTLPQALLILLEDQERWRIEQGLTDTAEVPNYLKYIYLDALEKVKPEAVTIIR